MVTIKCDSCKAVKPTDTIKDDGWILGTDLEVETAHALQRSIRFLDRWDDRRVLELGAIHFCCEECRDDYVSRSRAAA